jgi:hypothetical protein
MDEAFLAHAIIDPTAAVGEDRPEARAAKALGIQLLGLVSERPFARVWRARTHDGKQAALVVIADSATEADRERFALAADRLCSAGDFFPGIVRVEAIAPTRDAFVADLWTTGCAADLPTLQWSSRRRLDFVRRTTQALDVLHRAGIVHGCLCPDNILLDDDLKPVLAEAGMVSVHALLESKSDTSNYAAFAAPEVKRGEAPDVQSDIWSAGCLLEQLVSEKEVPEVAEVVRRCVATLARLRYPSAGELVKAIDAVIAALPMDDRLSRTTLPQTPVPVREKRFQLPESIDLSALSGRLLRWGAPIGAASILVATLATFLLGARTGMARVVLGAMFAVGAALAIWALPILPPKRISMRLALALSCGALVIVIDPVSSLLRAGAISRLHGDDAARRAAVAQIMDLDRDFRGMSLAGYNLSALDLTGADLRRADLSRANLAGAGLWSAQLQGASLDGARFFDANLEETALGEALNAEEAECDAATRLPGGWSCVRGKLLRE